VTFKTTVLAGDVPAALEQVSEYVMAPVLVGVSVYEPLGESTPFQPDGTDSVLPEAVQLVALTEDQVIVVVVSAAMEAAPSVSVGDAGLASAGVAVSVTEFGADAPPALLQVNVKVSLPTTVGLMILLPLTASSPLQLPEAVQLAASTDDHVIVVELPTATEVDTKDSVGAAGADPEVAVKITESGAHAPDELSQLNVYVALPAAVGVTTKLPLAGLAPLQAATAPAEPDAVQFVA